ncbi:MAG TPA: hypothetical protein VEZ18_15010 [Geodermatophilus sp.]|nr:hypothetical protein [Geodermatophilus sp.]
MTSPRPDTTERSELTEEKPQGAQLSATQVAAGALAAVSSAVVASFFGLAGTLIGAALASVISTVSAALYSNSLQKTNEKLRRARGQLTGRQDAVADAEPAPAVPAAPATKVLPAHLDPRRAPDRRPRPRWTRVAVYAAAVFALAMGIVTGIELIGQRPVSALVSGTETSTATTIGAITNASSSSSSDEESGDPATPSSPSTTAPATETSAPATGTDAESTSEEDEASGGEDSSGEGSGSEGSGSATPTRSSQAEPTTESEPTGSSDGSSEESTQDSAQDSAGDDTSPAAGAEPTP